MSDAPIPPDAPLDPPGHPDAGTAAFRGLAERAVDVLLEHDPVLATSLGDHTHDARLPDARPEALDEQRRALSGLLAELDAADVRALPTADAVDAEMLRTRLRGRLLALDELQPHRWDPLAWNPGTALYLLLARDFAPADERLRSLAGRCADVPAYLDTARRALGRMPRVHLETAVGQLTGTRTLLATEVERALADEPALRREVEPARDAAVAALDEHVRWLRARLEDPAYGEGRDPRIGADLYTRRLALTLDAQSDPDTLLARAEADLDRVGGDLVALAARLGGSPREVLDRLAQDGPVDDGTVLAVCERAMETTREHVRDLDLVTVHDDPVDVIVMPEIHRGVAVAYCDPPGPLEQRLLPTFFAVSPTPEDWPAERVRSFYREYNAHMLHNLTVHEAMPGHVVQLAHARRHAAATRVRAAFWSGSFVEGWAVLAEELMVATGYAATGPAGTSADAVRMQQLKMQLRMIINTILDVRVHCHGMTEAEAMALMTGRGYQEEGEAAGKWRRALLTSTQLATYYVGYTEVGDVLADLRRAEPGWTARRRHDALLSHGSPAPRHLRALLGLPAAGT